MTGSQASQQSLQNCWDRLLMAALRRGVPLPDAEELVSDSLLKAIDSFEPQRGAFYPFCSTILLNKIRNFWRDRDPSYHPPDGFEFPDDAPHPFEVEEDMRLMREMIDEILRALSPEEASFLKHLGVVMEEMEDRAISETARQLSISPSKGWDIFRRIQRKARQLYPRAPRARKVQAPMATEEPESMRADLDLNAQNLPIGGIVRVPNVFHIARAVVFAERFAAFTGRLDETLRKKVSLLFPS